jgi:D-alanine-D-alanine ligase-like ATP-grasp enzyme
MEVNLYPPNLRLTPIISTALVAIELERRGVPYRGSASEGVRFHRADGRRAFFVGGTLSANHRIANRICINKEATKAFLKAGGLPVARSDTFGSGESDRAAEFAAFLGYPVVVKHLSGMGGQGIWPNIQSPSALDEIWRRSVTGRSKYMVEKHVRGQDYRFLVVGDDVVASLQRIPPNVVGDGVNTLADLIAQKNALRVSTNNVVHRPIPLYPDLDLARIPSPGERVLLRLTANVSSGGDAIDVSEEVPQAFKRLAVAAVQAIPELAIGGVDILIADLAGEADGHNSTILEINHNPMLSMHHFPWVGTPRNVAAIVVDHLLGVVRPEPDQ